MKRRLRHFSLLVLLLMATPALPQDSAMNLDPSWEYVADTVMGGVSTGQLETRDIQGRQATRLTGDVSLDNNGGFVQMAFDLMPDGSAVDASDFTGIELDVIGNDEVYDLRLRTTALSRPWQSFRADFVAKDTWQTVRIPFAAFIPNKTDATFDPADLRRMGVLAYGRAFKADVAVAAVRFYR